MNNIKTQNIPTDLQNVSNKKTKSVAVSGENFKKALQTLVGEGVVEEPKTVDTPELQTSIEDDEEIVYIEVPWTLTSLSVLPDKVGISPNVIVEDSPQIELPQPTEQTMPEIIDAITITPDQLIEVEEVLEQPTFIHPEIKTEMETITNKPVANQEFSTLNSAEIIPKSNGKLTILENESDTQMISLTSEQVEITELIPVENQKAVTSIESVEMPTTVSELISQTGFEVEVEIDVEVEDKMTAETKTASADVQLEEVEVSEPVERTEKLVNTDISASGQLTQMKLTASQPQVQTETVKVVPQEQLVQEIETMIVENVEGPDQVEKVSTTRIQLTPKHLGELDIEIVMNNKELTARLVVEKAETKQWLEQKLTQLTKTLAEQDIKVEQFEIQVSNNHAGFTESSFNDNPFFKEQRESLNQRKSLHNNTEEEAIPEQVEKTVQSNTGRLSIWV